MKLRLYKPKLTLEKKIALTMAAHNIDTVIDIGANKGQTRDNLRKSGFKGDILSIEPLPALCEELKKKSVIDSRWTIMPPMALGEKKSECTLNISFAPDMSSLLPSTGALMTAYPKTRVIETVTVPVITLDDFYNEQNLSGKKVFVKIDTQGYEMNVLRGGLKTLEKITGLQVEMSLFELYKGETLFDEIIAFLGSKGFRPHLLENISFSKPLNRQLQIEGVFYKEKP